MMFQGSKFCPHCGARGQRAVAVEADAPCPKCQTSTLARILLGDTPVTECSRCHGLWVETATFEAICTDRERQSVVLGTACAHSTPGRSAPEKNIRYVRCPLCTQLMQRVNFAKCSGVILDVCKLHGSWFDRDELQRIVEFIRGGGLDRARAKEKADLDQARRRLETARSPGTTWVDREPRATWSFGESDLASIAGSIAAFLLNRD
jgi:Zn-finger nucleic acid-binding protein